MGKGKTSGFEPLTVSERTKLLQRADNWQSASKGGYRLRGRVIGTIGQYNLAIAIKGDGRSFTVEAMTRRGNLVDQFDVTPSDDQRLYKTVSGIWVMDEKAVKPYNPDKDSQLNLFLARMRKILRT